MDCIYCDFIVKLNIFQRLFHAADDDGDVRNCRQVEDQQKLEMSQLRETIATLQQERDCLKSEKVVTLSCNNVVFFNVTDSTLCYIYIRAGSDQFCFNN